MRGKIDIDRVLELARLEEEFQIKEWGMVEGGHDISRAEVRVATAAMHACGNQSHLFADNL